MSSPRPSLDAMDALIQIVEAGSLTAAARRLGVAKSVLSDRLHQLEKTLGVTVLRRSTRRMSLTEAGQRYYEHARQILEQVADASAEAARMAGAPGALHGRLRIAAPVSFGAAHLGRALMPFLASHPALECQIELSDGTVDLLEGHFDLAVRIGRLPDSTLVARSLGVVERVVCASPTYLAEHGAPESTEALRDHATIGYSHVGAARLWTFLDGDGKPYVASTPPPRITANNGELIRDAAIAGLGIAVLPRFIVEDALRLGQLVIVLAQARLQRDTLNLVYPKDRRLPRKTREALNFLAQVLGADGVSASAPVSHQWPSGKNT